jgi:phosphoenolpyruvate synthase/pyruvate phosphate dikinase
MTVAVAGGTNEVDVPRFLRDQPSLNDEQVIEVAQLALTLDATMSHPVDIECAYAGGKLYSAAVPANHDAAVMRVFQFSHWGLISILVGAGAEPAVAAVPVDFQSRGFVHIPTEKVNSAIVDRFLATYLWRACKLPRPEN